MTARDEAALRRLNGRRTAALLVSTALALAIGFGHSAAAQTAGNPSGAVHVDIPAEALDAAIRDFIRATGLQVAYPAALSQGKQSAGVRGDLPPNDALARLLAGTGLSYRYTSATTVTLEATSPTTKGAMTLPPVQVEGQAQIDAQSAYGPGVGYVATRSASATKTDTPLIEVPQSVSVVTQQQMQDQQPQNVGQALRYTAGIVPESTGVQSFVSGPGYDLLLLRGFAPDTYLDGLNHNSWANNEGTFIDPYLLNRIEVVNGPASVLYGQASPGGFVNMESKLPTETPLHEVQLGFGSYGQYEGAFDLSGPLDKDGQFLYRLTGIGMSENSQVDFTKTQELAIAPAFTWRPDADTTFTLLGKYQNYPSVGAYAPVPAMGSVLPNPNGKISTSFFSGEPSYNNFSNSLASIGYDFEHRFNDIWSVKQEFLYQHNNSIYSEIYPSGLGADNQTLSRYAFYDNDNFNSIVLDNQATAKFSTGPVTHAVTFGLDYMRFMDYQLFGFDFSYPSIDIFAPVYSLPPPGPISLSGQTQTQNQIGVYAQDQLSLGRWHLLMGARGDYATEDYFTTSLPTNEITGRSHYTTSAPSWRVGLVYLFDNGLAPYVSYTTSFQPQLGATFNETPFQPTTAQQYEVGVKYQPIGWNSFITAALYNLAEQNVLTPDPVHVGFSTQTGEVRSRGVELQAHANLTNNLNVIATYTYTNATNTQSNATGTSITGATESEQGKWPVAVPAQMASLWANYTISDGPARGLGFGGGVRYIGSSYGDAVNSFKVPGFTVFDAMLHYDLRNIDPDLKGLTLQVNATNLFDKTYVASCSSSSQCWYGLRRTVYATLKYDW